MNNEEQAASCNAKQQAFLDSHDAAMNNAQAKHLYPSFFAISRTDQMQQMEPIKKLQIIHEDIAIKSSMSTSNNMIDNLSSTSLYESELSNNVNFSIENSAGDLLLQAMQRTALGIPRMKPTTISISSSANELIDLNSSAERDCVKEKELHVVLEMYSTASNPIYPTETYLIKYKNNIIMLTPLPALAAFGGILYYFIDLGEEHFEREHVHEEQATDYDNKRLHEKSNCEQCMHISKLYTFQKHVEGFKIMLAASSTSCHLSVDAKMNVYQFDKQPTNTTILCNARLPDTAYNVPLTGILLITLLNPLNKPMRIFEIPYDLQEMPAYHETFLKERCLMKVNVNDDASDSLKPPDYENIVAAEQIKCLRYSLQLKFRKTSAACLYLYSNMKLLLSGVSVYDEMVHLKDPDDLIIDRVIPSFPIYFPLS